MTLYANPFKEGSLSHDDSFFFLLKKNGHEFYHLGGVLVALEHCFGFHVHLGHNTNTNLDQKYIFDDLTGLERCSVKSNLSPKISTKMIKIYLLSNYSFSNMTGSILNILCFWKPRVSTFMIVYSDFCEIWEIHVSNHQKVSPIWWKFDCVR